MKEARFYSKIEGDRKIKCELCPHFCVIKNGKRGICNVRENREGVLYSMIYANVTSTAMDPIEKKPLYHFYPGTSILSLGTYGCSFSCPYCQNWEISQGECHTRKLEAEEAVELAERNQSIGIAYTYNEPYIWFEYVYDTAKIAKEKGLKNVLVTNGYYNPEPFEELLPFIDAMNIDIKSINESFYKKLCKGEVGPVLETAKRARREIHIEITNLVITDENDSDKDLEGLATWIADNLGKDTPVHLSAYFPRYKFRNPPTSGETLKNAFDIFKSRLQHVFLGNVLSREGSDTTCHDCGTTLIERSGYSTRVLNLDPSGRCGDCGSENNIVL